MLKINRYLILFIFSVKIFAENKVDLIVFSYNRPMQLYAFLESVQKFVTNLSQIKVVHRMDDKYVSAYQEVQEHFKWVEFYRHQDSTDFKYVTLKNIFETFNDYVLFAVDDIIVTDFIDIDKCVNALVESEAYCFLLRLGSNIKTSYMIGKDNSAPKNNIFKNNIYIYEFKNGVGEWNYPNNLDMTLYKKSDIKSDIFSLNMTRPGNFEGDWALIPKLDKKGLFFEHSKIVNIPMNLAQETGNKNMRLYSTGELLNKFNEGYKIDINEFYKINNDSPHMAYVPKFIKR